MNYLNPSGIDPDQLEKIKAARAARRKSGDYLINKLAPAIQSTAKPYDAAKK